MPSQPKRAVIYCRLSKDVTGEGAGVQRQLEDARNLALVRGWTVVGEPSDNDTSAAGSKHRPGFDAVLEDVTTGHANVVIAWAWDRLSRNRRDTLKLIETGQQHKVLVALVRGSDIDMSNAAGRLVADLLAGVARAEIDAKGERQERANLQRAQAGKPPSRRAFGYLRDGTPHPKEAPAVIDAFGSFLAGTTMVGIAKQLTTAGFTSTRGKQWDDTGVRVMLTNPRYIGERHYRGERIAAGEWPALITDETFAAVQGLFAASKMRTRRPARRYLGGSLFVCGRCGADAETTVKVTYNNAGVRAYGCSKHAHLCRAADPIDNFVQQVIVERLRRPDASSLGSPDSEVDVAALRGKALGYRTRLAGLANDYADGVLDAAQVKAATARIKQQLNDIESTLAAAGQTSSVAAIASAADMGQEWLNLPLDRQRAVLDAIATVVILPARKGRPPGGRFDPASVEIRPK